MNQALKTLAATASLLLIGCGGGDGETQTPPIPPVVQNFSAVAAEVDRLDVVDMTIIIGNADGELFRYEKGAMTAETQLPLGSASKLLTGIAVWSLIDDEQLSTSTNPQEHIDFWTDDPADSRSAVTLEQLMSFRSGFNSSAARVSCPGDAEITLEDCISELYNGGTASEPGAGFSYGPDHMQITSLMVRDVAGKDLREVLQDNIWDVASVSDQTVFDNDSDNVRYSADMSSTAEDYGKILTALLDEQFFDTDEGYLDDRTNGVPSLQSIRAITDAEVDWHYGFGFWVECDTVPFSDDCTDDPTISSPGVFGFLPWVDFDNGYWGVIGMEEPAGRTPIPSLLAVEFQQVIQPIIEAEFE